MLAAFDSYVKKKKSAKLDLVHTSCSTWNLRQIKQNLICIFSHGFHDFDHEHNDLDFVKMSTN